ncbi:hypothetical protein HT031_000969 [Scenedesmus sp. PABB004]|nr:hypothetical protein HT031_000969 [Scenedesmus sp. PABB004]
MEVGFIEVFPPRAAGSRPPALLQTLEARLLEATNAAARAAGAGPHQRRDPALAANLALDVLAAFIDGFSAAYAPLLRDVQAAFDGAIAQGLRDALDASALRAKLLAARAAQAAAARAARAEVIDGQAAERACAHRAIAAAQARLAAAERRRAVGARDLARARQELAHVHALARASRAAKARQAEAAAAEAEWAAKPGAAGMLSMVAEPLSKQEEEELEAELGVAAEAATPKHPLQQALELLEAHDAAAAARLLEQTTGAAGG